MSIKVIGAGFPRTGTMSLKQALNVLGYHTYHMEEVAKNHRKGHIQLWQNYFQSNTQIDWDNLFEGYDATTDFPAAFCYKAIFDHYPDAKVILGVRDPESWYQSIAKLMGFSKTLRRIFFIPPLRKLGIFTDVNFDVCFGKQRKKEDCIRIFLAHIEAVKKTVPPHQLLVFSAEDGWAPLCRFLQCPIPDVPYPHSNAGLGTLNQKLQEAIAQEIWWSPYLWSVALVLLGLAYVF